MRVVHVSLQLDTGGMEKLLVEFAKHADRKRFDLRFVSLSSRGVVADELEGLGYEVIALHEPAGLRPQLVMRLASLFREWKPDVIHAHNTKPLIYCSPAAKMAGVKRTIYTRHGQRFGARWRRTLLLRWAAKLADAVVCVSEDGAMRSIKEGIAANKVCTIWNGIDVSSFGYVGPSSAGPAIMVGRLSPEKDIPTLLEATALARAQEPAFHVEIAGDGPCLPALQEHAAKLGISSEHVRFLGRVRDVPALLARASMGVLSSVTEGISLTLLEAMARGLPVVATRVGGNPEIICHDQTGLLVPCKDPSMLAEAMLRVWRNPQRGREMGIEGRKRVELFFDVRTMVGKYEQLYVGAEDQPGPRDEAT